jgi:16S rRNA (guanine1207-N2)-methyltransferase
MSSDHYFSETPDSQYKPKEIQVVIDGKTVVVTTAGGIFSPDHIDQGTGVLLNHLDEVPPSGNILDIGCGWGPIALSLASRAPQATIWAIDVNQRSLDLTAANAKRLGLTNIKTAKPDEVPADISFSAIWSNPPIRVGKDVLHEILLTWLPRLSIDAESYLVVQKNLGADSLSRWLETALGDAFSVIRVETAKGFRVLRVKNRADH